MRYSIRKGREIFALGRRQGSQSGVFTPPAPHAISRESRQALLETSQRAALSDPAFAELIKRGDQLRDEGRWPEAAAAYGDALRCHPYERSYWTQLGHMLKEQEQFGPAEIAYRTSAAFGSEPQDVRPHFVFVMKRQGASEAIFPLRFQQAAAQHRQVPGRPDVIAFGRLLWAVQALDDEDQLKLLRLHDTLDGLMAAMIRDPRFERANRAWLELVHGDEL